jgi:hypothetical protein
MHSFLASLHLLSDHFHQFVSWLDANGEERLWGIDVDTALTGAMITFFCCPDFAFALNSA